VHLVGFIIRIYHDARSCECQISWKWFFFCYFVLLLYYFVYRSLENKKSLLWNALKKTGLHCSWHRPQHPCYAADNCDHILGDTLTCEVAVILDQLALSCDVPNHYQSWMCECWYIETTVRSCFTYFSVCPSVYNVSKFSETVVAQSYADCDMDWTTGVVFLAGNEVTVFTTVSALASVYFVPGDRRWRNLNSFVQIRHHSIIVN